MDSTYCWERVEDTSKLTLDELIAKGVVFSVTSGDTFVGFRDRDGVLQKGFISRYNKTVNDVMGREPGKVHYHYKVERAGRFAFSKRGHLDFTMWVKTREGNRRIHLVFDHNTVSEAKRLPEPVAPKVEPKVTPKPLPETAELVTLNTHRPVLVRRETPSVRPQADLMACG